MVLETLVVVVEAAWVAMTTLVMRETTVTIVLVDIGAVLMTLMSLVMMVSGEAVLVPLEKAETMVMVGAAMVGVAMRVLTMGDRKEALQWQ